MTANGFREEELVSRRVKVGNEWQTRTFPVVGGRLRLVHEDSPHVTIQTEILKFDSDFAGVKAMVTTEKGVFHGTGTASAQRDARLADSLVELAETRSIARALRFAGYGLEFCGAEEIAAITNGDQDSERTGDKAAEKVFPQENGGGKTDTSSQDGASATGKAESKPQRCGNGQATQAQVRALFALTKRANYTDEDTESLLRPFNVSTFQELSREAASQLITSLQTEAAAA